MSVAQRRRKPGRKQAAQARSNLIEGVRAAVGQYPGVVVRDDPVTQAFWVKEWRLYTPLGPLNISLHGYEDADESASIFTRFEDETDRDRQRREGAGPTGKMNFHGRWHEVADTVRSLQSALIAVYSNPVITIDERDIAALARVAADAGIEGRDGEG